MKLVVKKQDIYCLQSQFGVAKEHILKAIASVGNDRNKIAQYLYQHKLMNYNVNLKNLLT